jgi:3-oxoadipate enol-lactonase
VTSTSIESTGTVSVRGAELAYSSVGSGPVVIAAHGLTASRASNLATGLLDLSPLTDAGYTLISYDARGHGESTGTTDPEDYLWSSLADDMLSFAEAVAPGQRVAVVGNSMGTATALFAALKDTDRIAALVLTAPPTAWQSRAAQSDVYLRMADALERNDQETLAEMFAGMSEPEIFADMLNEPLEPDIKPELMPTIMRGAAATNLPDPEVIATIKQETLLLPWAADPGHPVSTAVTLAESMINSRLRIAHTAEQVKAFGAWSAAFLQEVFG